MPYIVINLWRHGYDLFFFVRLLVEWVKQVGVTPEGVEVPRSLVDEDMKEKLSKMPEVFQPSTPEGPDPKWRYMWRVGPRPSNTRFQVVNFLNSVLARSLCKLQCKASLDDCLL